MTEQIEGIVSSIVYTNAGNGYSVLRLDSAEGMVTASGVMPGVSLGERLRISGVWSTHPQYGEQFTAQSFETLPVTGIEEVYRYLASGAVKNIGPGRARDIVDKFGEAALGIIENDPDRLSSVKGISLRTARKIGSGYQQQAALRRLISFFREYNIKPLVATWVYKIYGGDSMEAVRGNPYIIVSEEHGAQFFEADAIAIDLGLEPDCPQRVCAALIYTLTHNLSNGHTFIPKDKLTSAVSGLIGVPGECISEALDMLCEHGEIVCETVAGQDACYLQHIFDAERFVADTLLSKLKTGSGKWKIKDKRSASNDGSAAGGITYSEAQLEALRLASQHGVLVLTGGPGTGKTTTVQGILKLFTAAGLKTNLCAPTGRAAKRLSELCRCPAATIHRLLGAGPDEGGGSIFEYNENNPLELDAIIVDETSMVDILLMNSLLRALPGDCCIILVGDADQLPSIGPGNVFKDIIGSGAVPVVRLTEIFRQAQGSGIVRGAHSVNKGVMPDLTEKYPDMFFMQRRSDELIAETIAGLCSERLPKNMNIDPSQIQVLSPTRKKASGTNALNMLLRERLNPPGALKKEKKSGEHIYRTGDRVMQVKNNYTIASSNGTGVFNGDTGIIADIDHNKETVTVKFDDKSVVYAFDQLHELEPAYAITVHKSQGSEFRAVILAMTAAAPQLLTRAVLYTAMTRARELLIITGSPEIMQKMVQNDKRQKRYSGLRHRLQG